MLFAMICKDKPGSLDLRLATRAAHLDYLGDLNAKGHVKLGGPFLDDDGKPCGSLLIVEAASARDAKAIADGDPYARAGLFENVEIRPWNWVVNKPEA